METPEIALEEIGRLILEGYTSGRLDNEQSVTSWSLTTETWSNEED